MASSILTENLHSNFYFQNITCEKWLLNWSRGTGVIRITGQLYQVTTLMKELERDLFALGDGHFVIDQMFVFKVICKFIKTRYHKNSALNDLVQFTIKLLLFSVCLFWCVPRVVLHRRI